ncbi:hypothetical protein WJ438_00795 [Streptomyces sp. GD-15H]|uniref:hypothetical protein n=1 Tax=Streptomyces sp. GD-15H TaxID=3129112 RepID=UPI00324E6B55
MTDYLGRKPVTPVRRCRPALHPQPLLTTIYTKIIPRPEPNLTTPSGVLFGTECLEIFQSVSADGDLERAVVANTHRRYVFPSTARADIEDAAAGLFRTGLLRPAPDLQ